MGTLLVAETETEQGGSDSPTCTKGQVGWGLRWRPAEERRRAMLGHVHFGKAKTDEYCVPVRAGRRKIQGRMRYNLCGEMI